MLPSVLKCSKSEILHICTLWWPLATGSSSISGSICGHGIVASVYHLFTVYHHQLIVTSSVIKQPSNSEMSFCSWTLFTHSLTQSHAAKD